MIPVMIPDKLVAIEPDTTVIIELRNGRVDVKGEVSRLPVIKQLLCIGIHKVMQLELASNQLLNTVRMNGQQ